MTFLRKTSTLILLAGGVLLAPREMLHAGSNECHPGCALIHACYLQEAWYEAGLTFLEPARLKKEWQKLLTRFRHSIRQSGMKKAKIEVTGDDKQWEVNVTMPCGPRSVRASPRGAAFVIAGIVEREQSFVYADQLRRYFDCQGRYLGRGKGLEPAEYGVPCSFDEVSVEEISVSLDGAAKKVSYIEIEQADNVEKAYRQKIYRVVESPLDFIRSDDLIVFPERRELPSLDGKTSRLDYCGATLAIMSRRQARNVKIACVSD